MALLRPMTHIPTLMIDAISGRDGGSPNVIHKYYWYELHLREKRSLT